METKRVKVIMLPTEDNTDVVLYEHTELKYKLSLQDKIKGICGWTNQHLYITTDDEIKELPK